MTAVSEPSIKMRISSAANTNTSALTAMLNPMAAANAPRIPLWMRSVFCAP